MSANVLLRCKDHILAYFKHFHCDTSHFPGPVVLHFSDGGCYKGSWMANKQHGKGRVPRNCLHSESRVIAPPTAPSPPSPPLLPAISHRNDFQPGERFGGNRPPPNECRPAGMPARERRRAFRHHRIFPVRARALPPPAARVRCECGGRVREPLL